jgi:uncharacterized membrane protein
MGVHQTVVVAFDLEWEAGEALERMLELETSGAIRVDDAVVVTTDESGAAHLSQTHHPPGLGAVGGLLGLLVGVLLPGGFGIAAAGLAAGTALGSADSIARSQREQELQVPLIRHLAEALQAGRSVLGLVFHDADRGALLAELEPLRGQLMEGSLSDEDVAAIDAALARRS